MGEDGQSILEQLQESFADFMWSMGSRFATDESGKLWRARSRLYQRRCLRLKFQISNFEQFFEIYIIVTFAPLESQVEKPGKTTQKIPMKSKTPGMRTARLNGAAENPGKQRTRHVQKQLPHSGIAKQKLSCACSLGGRASGPASNTEF